MFGKKLLSKVIAFTMIFSMLIGALPVMTGAVASGSVDGTAEYGGGGYGSNVERIDDRGVGINIGDDNVVLMDFADEFSYTLPYPRTISPYSVEKALFNRRSQRSYETRAITAKQLSQILWAAYGMTAPGRKTSPSAGAQYCLELYVAVGNVEGISPGIYKYNSLDHKIVRIREGDVRTEINIYSDAPAALLYSGDFERALDVYGEEDFKYVYMEAGHSAQNVYLQAEALGLGTVAIGAFIDSRVSQILGLPANETPLYIMPIGYFYRN